MEGTLYPSERIINIQNEYKEGEPSQTTRLLVGRVSKPGCHIFPHLLQGLDVLISGREACDLVAEDGTLVSYVVLDNVSLHDEFSNHLGERY